MVEEYNIEKLKINILWCIKTLQTFLAKAALEVESGKTSFVMVKGYLAKKKKVGIEELGIQDSDSIRVLGYIFGKGDNTLLHWKHVKEKVIKATLIAKKHRRLINRFPLK